MDPLQVDLVGGPHVLGVDRVQHLPQQPRAGDVAGVQLAGLGGVVRLAVLGQLSQRDLQGPARSTAAAAQTAPPVSASRTAARPAPASRTSPAKPPARATAPASAPAVSSAHQLSLWSIQHGKVGGPLQPHRRIAGAVERFDR
jgi:hypothetical protein